MCIRDRAFYSHGDLFPAHGLQKRIHTSFAAVCHRHAVHLGIRIIFLHRLCHYGTDLGDVYKRQIRAYALFL